MLRVALTLAFVVAAYISAASAGTTTTAKPHHHHNTTAESAEHALFKFFYEPHTHQMVVVNGHMCYVFTLSDAERVAVHTDAGINALELKLLGLLTTGTKTMTTKDQLDHHLARACGQHATDFYTVM